MRTEDGRYVHVKCEKAPEKRQRGDTTWRRAAHYPLTCQASGVRRHDGRGHVAIGAYLVGFACLAQRERPRRQNLHIELACFHQPDVARGIAAVVRPAAST